MVDNTKPQFGLGVYRIADVARYIGMHHHTVRTWFQERSDAKGLGPVLASDYGTISGTLVVSFLDLIDALIASQFRNLGVSMKEVRRAHKVLAVEIGVQHPFCHEDLYTDGQRILRITLDQSDDERLSEVVSNQLLFTQIKERLAKVGYSKSTKLAEYWDIAKGVVINPAVAMGHPVVTSTGTCTYVVANSYLANHQNAGIVADLFDLNELQVMDAVRFESSLKSAA